MPAASHGRGGELLKTAAQREGGRDRGPEEEAGTAGKGAEIDCTLIHSTKVQKEILKCLVFFLLFVGRYVTLSL